MGRDNYIILINDANLRLFFVQKRKEINIYSTATKNAHFLQQIVLESIMKFSFRF